MENKELQRIMDIIRKKHIKGEKIDPNIAIQLVRWIEERKVDEDRIKNTLKEKIADMNDVMIYDWF